MVATPEKHHTQQARLSGGVFSVGQTKTGKEKGLATFTLKENAFPGGPSYASCTVGKKPRAAATSTPVAKATKVSSKVLQLLKPRQTRQLPDHGALQRRHRPRHSVGGRGSLRRHADQGEAR